MSGSDTDRQKVIDQEYFHEQEDEVHSLVQSQEDQEDDSNKKEFLKYAKAQKNPLKLTKEQLQEIRQGQQVQEGQEENVVEEQAVTYSLARRTISSTKKKTLTLKTPSGSADKSIPTIQPKKQKEQIVVQKTQRYEEDQQAQIDQADNLEVNYSQQTHNFQQQNNLKNEEFSYQYQTQEANHNYQQVRPAKPNLGPNITKGKVSAMDARAALYQQQLSFANYNQERIEQNARLTSNQDISDRKVDSTENQEKKINTMRHTIDSTHHQIFQQPYAPIPVIPQNNSEQSIQQNNSSKEFVEPEKPLIQRGSRILQAPHIGHIQGQEHRHSGSVRSGGSRSPKPVVHFTYSTSNKNIAPPPARPQPQPQYQSQYQSNRQLKENYYMHQSQHSFHSQNQSHRIIQKPQSQPPQIYSYGPPPMQYRQQPPPPPPQQIIQHTNTTIIWERHYLQIVQKFTFFTEKYEQFYTQYRIISDQLDVASSQAEIHELKMKNTLLLQKMSETQRQISLVLEENKQLQKEIEQQKLYETEGQFAFAKRYATLEKHCRELQFQIQKMKQSDELSSHNEQTISMIEQLKTQMKKYEGVNIELQNYIKQLQADNHNMEREIKRLSVNVNHSNDEKFEIIQNQQKIIRDLEYQLQNMQGSHKNDFESGRMSTSQQSAQITIQNQQITIQSLEQRIIELERENKEAGGSSYGTYNASEDQYRRIVETQENIIANLQAQLKELSDRPDGIEREEFELKKTIENQENIINNLQNQIYNLQQLHGSSHESEAIIAQKDALIAQLEQTIRMIEEEKNTIKGQYSIVHSQIQQIRREKVQYKEMMERRLDEKLTLIQEQLKGNKNLDRYPQVSPRKGPSREQIGELEAEIDRLASEVRRKQIEKRKVEEELLNVDEGYKRAIMEKDSHIRLLNDQSNMLNEEMNRKLSEKDRKIRSLEEELSSRNTTGVRQVTPIIEVSSSSNEEIKSLKDQLRYKNEENAELTKQKGIIDKKARTLQQSLNALEEQLSKKNQELISLRRQISGVVTYEQQINSLTDSITKKNQQILQLKAVVFERNEMKIQIEALKNERNSLKETLKNRTKEEEKLKQMITELEIKLKGKSPQKYIIPTSMDSSSDLQFMQQSVRRKQTQITKLKQSVQLKDTNIEQLQYEVEKLKGKLNSAERALNHERQDAKQKISYLEGRIKQLEQKAKILDESQRHNRNTYEVQLQNLENMIKQKQDINRKLEGQLKVLKNKLRNHDSKTQQYEKQIQSLNEKIRQLENAKSQLKKHIDGLQESGHLDKNKLYDEYQIKIVELEAAAKMKDQKIKHMQNNIETLKLKMNDSGNQKEEDFINQQQIQVLRKKVAEYQSKIHHYTSHSKVNNYQFTQYHKDFDAMRIFENKLIYNLKKENEMLRENQNGNYQTSSSNVRNNKSQHVDYIQKRLYDFNQKLEEMIKENRELEETGEFHPTPQRFANEQMLRAFERNKITLIKKHNKEIKAMQARMVDLQRYCSHLQNFQGTSSTVVNNNTIIDNNKTIINEQIVYYKEKNKQLEERIDSHIKLNKELKERLQSLLKSCGDQNALQFYKQQLDQLQKQNEDYLNQIKILTEQNRQLQKSLQKYCTDNTMEIKVTELENVIQELKRKLSQLQMQNSILTADLDKYTREIQVLNENNSRLDATVHQKIRIIDNLENGVIREFKEKCENYELTITKMANKNKFLQAEIQRLNEVLSNKQKDDNSQISKLKNRIMQMQQAIRNWQMQGQRWGEDKQSYQYNMSSLNRKISNLQQEIQRLNELLQTYGRNDREHEESMRQIIYERNSLKEQLRVKTEEAEELANLVDRLRRERDSDGSQARDRLAYISQIQDQMRQLKLENQNLKVTQTIYKQQIESQQRDIERLNKEIMRLRESSTDAGELQRINRQLREEIDEEKKSNARANNEIERLRQQIQHLENQLHSLRAHLEQISSKMAAYDNLMESIAYHMEYLRSTFLESDALLGQIKTMKIDNVQANVIQAMRANVQKGLIKCSQVFAMI